jgi:hypothetical protein
VLQETRAALWCAPPALRERALQYLNTRSAALLDVADDGSSLLIATRFASTVQLHVVEMPLLVLQERALTVDVLLFLQRCADSAGAFSSSMAW